MSEAARKVCFGSCQDRKLFPYFYAPDRIGVEMSGQMAQLIGPGHYDNHTFDTMMYVVRTTPGSTKGYLARTAGRFPPRGQTWTISPDKYQPDQSKSRVPPPGKTPFDAVVPRFSSTRTSAEDVPGPGTYNHKVTTNRKVSWPMSFGRPEWSKVPQFENKSLRGKLKDEEEFLRHRNRLAYLSLYY